MKRQIRKPLAAGTLAALCLLASGCGSFKFAASPEELYQLPQLPAEYTALNSSISALLSAGEEYAAPVSGTNTQSVQMVDLDGDGHEEALAFLRNSAEEKPLKIHVFAQDGDSYRQSAVIEGSGTAIYSVAYRDLDGDGVQEILVGWKAAADLQALSVYSLRDSGPVELAQAGYVKYAVTDLDRSRPELEVAVLHTDEQGSSVADLYTFQQDGALGKTSSARLSMTMAELNAGRVSSGTLRNGASALFVSGVSDSGEEIIDVLTLRDGELANIVLSDTTGVTTELFRYLSLYPNDINSDGITEAPVPEPLPTLGPDMAYLVGWRSYDENGEARTVGYTYHNIDDGWYLELPEAWKGIICVTRSQSGVNEIATTFSIWDGVESVEDFLRIYTITGSGREVRASKDNRFVLSRQAETIYAAELLQANSSWSCGITEDALRGSFKRITTEWRASDN